MRDHNKASAAVSTHFPAPGTTTVYTPYSSTGDDARGLLVGSTTAAPRDDEFAGNEGVLAGIEVVLAPSAGGCAGSEGVLTPSMTGMPGVGVGVGVGVGMHE
jgi:hypothetical protein